MDEHRERFRADRRSNLLCSFCVVKDHTEGVSMTGADPAYAMPEIDAVVSARPPNWPEMHGERHRVALGERHHVRPRLHARALLGQHEFTAGKIASRL